MEAPEYRRVVLVLAAVVLVGVVLLPGAADTDAVFAATAATPSEPTPTPPEETPTPPESTPSETITPPASTPTPPESSPTPAGSPTPPEGTPTPPSSGGSVTVTSLECVANCGGVRTDDISPRATLGSRGETSAANVRLTASGSVDLSAVGATSDTRFRVSLRIAPSEGSFDPRTLVVIGQNAEFVSRSAGDPATATVEFGLTEGSVNFDVRATDPADWPDREVTASRDASAVGIVNVADVAGSESSHLRGVTMATNAQVFEAPSYQSPGDAEQPALKLHLAAPHYESDGSTVNTGHFRAFLPDRLLSEWGVSDPGQLTATAPDGGGSVSVSETAGGLTVTLTDYHYSAGNVTVTPAESTAGSTTDPLEFSIDAPTTTPNSTAEATMTVENTNGTSLTGVVVDVTRLPSGWSIASVSNDSGVWRDSSREWLWLQLADGAAKSPSVTLAIPNDTAPGAYEVAATARVDDFAAAASANVTVTERGASIAAAIAGSDGRIGTADMLQAIGYWANGQAVPGTGKTISTTKLLELIDLWSRGAAV